MADCPAPRKGRAQGSIRWHNAPEGTEETKNGKGRGMGNPVVHFEIVSKEGGKLKSFYSEAFGWKIDADNAMGYGMVEAEGEGIGGGVADAPGDYPGHLTFYIQTDDLEGTLARIEELGGETVMPPDSVGDGTTIAQFKDPGGNMVGLVKGM